MNSWERQEEKIIAGVFKRPERYYIFDEPYYPYFPNKKQPYVNFDLNYPQ